jgi:hypothetical protein
VDISTKRVSSGSPALSSSTAAETLAAAAAQLPVVYPQRIRFPLTSL